MNLSVTTASFQGLTVRYGAFTALADFTVELPAGCIGLLGPNGAGKSTLLKTLLGFVKPTSGSAQILGMNLATQGSEIRRMVGYMPEQDCHIPGLPAVEFVAYAGELAGLPAPQALRRAHEVIEHCGLGEARYRQVETFSTGMKQRIKLAQALVHGPKLLLLDEPTNGLDPRGREEMLNLIRSVSHGKGLSVVVSSHLLKDIERTCDHVVVVMQGRLRSEGPIRDLREVEGRPLDLVLREPSPAFIAAVEAAGHAVEQLDRGLLRLTIPGTVPEASRLCFQIARETGAQIRRLGVAQRTLEDAFMEVVSHG